jgi:hypothetical protein
LRVSIDAAGVVRAHDPVMSQEVRAAASIALLLGGGLVLLLLGGQVAMCLGPLGVTAVQCYAATGRTPTAGPSTPAGALLIVLGLLILLPVAPKSWAAALLAATAAGAVAGAAYLALRPRTMEGPGSTGAWFVVQLPLDPDALAAVVIAGAGAAAILTGRMARSRGLREGRGPSRRPPARSHP